MGGWVSRKGSWEGWILVTALGLSPCRSPPATCLLVFWWERLYWIFELTDPSSFIALAVSSSAVTRILSLVYTSPCSVFSLGALSTRNLTALLWRRPRRQPPDSHSQLLISRLAGCLYKAQKRLKQGSASSSPNLLHPLYFLHLHYAFTSRGACYL